MRILHYSLGFPPYRSGGLTKFCLDLMIEQKNEGDEVALLWPGQMGFINKKIKIKKRKSYLNSYQEIESFELVNPLPISFDEGIKAFENFTLKGDKNEFYSFLKSFKPDVIHVHTLMGIHKEFFEVAKNLNIRLVFTAHDFFPICSKVTLFRNGKICDSVDNCKKCASCNSTALSINKIQILQSPIYRTLKDSTLVKKLRKSHRDRYLSDNTFKSIDSGPNKDYIDLRNYYYSMLLMMDIIHFNSTITKKNYEKYFDLPNSAIIPVSHSSIKNNCKIKNYNHDKLRIRYLGPASKAKGFYLLKECLDDIWKERQDFVLDIHFNPIEKSDYMNIHERYNYDELNNIFDETDVLLVPSILYETFGFTALEGLSFGVPVIVSDTVGAQDILMDKFGIIVNNITKENLKKVFENLSFEDLKNMNQSIVNLFKVISIEDVSILIKKMCYKCNEV